MARLGRDGLVKAGCGVALRGLVRQGLSSQRIAGDGYPVGFDRVRAWPGAARIGTARHDLAWRGWDWRGLARAGIPSVKARALAVGFRQTGAARYVRERFGGARPGLAGHGSARAVPSGKRLRAFASENRRRDARSI